MQAGQCREVQRRPGAARLQTTAVKGARERSWVCWEGQESLSKASDCEPFELGLNDG